MPWFSTSKEKEIRDIRDELERLKSDFKMLRLEWEDAYDKMRTLTARFTKRAQQIEKHDAQDVQESGSPTGSGTATSTSPHLDPMSKRILDRRARMFAPVKKEESA